MKMILIIYAIFILKVFALAQQVTYTKPSEDDVQFVNFNIIGKLNNHYLIYKHNQQSDDVMVYNDDMELVNKVNMNFLPRQLMCYDIVTCKNYFYFIYQHQKANLVTCMAVRMNDKGEVIDSAHLVDTTALNYSAGNRIYNVLYSENKQKIVVFKIVNRGDGVYRFTSCLFDTGFNLLDRFSDVIPTNTKSNYISNFKLNDNGSIAFVKISDNIISKKAQNINLFIKNPHSNSFNVFPVDSINTYMDDIRLQEDNLNNRLLITGFFSNQREGNIDGFYCAVWNKNANQIISSKQTVFTKEFKSNANSKGPASLNSFYLQNIFMRKNSGFTTASEYMYTSANADYDNPVSQPFNVSLLDYSGINSYGFVSGSGALKRKYYAENIAVLSFDSAANMQWSAIIPKHQSGNNSFNYISYSTYLTTGDIHFLFNHFTKRSTVMQSIQLNAAGKTAISSSLKNLDRNYTFMPSFAKQVSNNQIIIPCAYKNKLCFAKIEF